MKYTFNLRERNVKKPLAILKRVLNEIQPRLIEYDNYKSGNRIFASGLASGFEQYVGKDGTKNRKFISWERVRHKRLYCPFIS